MFSPRYFARLTRSFVYVFLSCELVIGTSNLDVLPAAKATKVAPTPSTLTWYRGNTHTHTNNSDGDSSPSQVAARYKELGYNFVVISDHNRLTDVDSLNTELGEAGRFLVMKGEEVTDSCNGKPVHINGLNNQFSIVPQHGTDVLNTIENDAAAIRQAGGLSYIAHPNFGFAVTSDDLTTTGTSLFEIYNAHPVVNNYGDASHPSVEAMWDIALSRGKLRYGIAADDEHTLTNPSGALPGRAWVMVRAASLDPAAIADAMQRGDFYASTGVTLQDYQVGSAGIIIAVDNTVGGPFSIDFIGKNGRLLQHNTSSTASYTFTGDEMYVRAKIVGAAGQIAWTQPVFTARLNAGNAILNGASLGNEPQTNKVVAPDSIATMSGFGLARETLQSNRNSDGLFPTTLGGASVSVNGRPAEIYYVSNTQVNFHVPDETELGAADVILTNADGIQLHSQLTIESAAPGIFTEDGSGQGRAVVFETTRLLPRLFFPNDSARRFLIYVTGVSAVSPATVLVDNQPVAIESLRECRHLPGLYQINVAIPSTLSITTGSSLVVRVAGKDSNATILHLE